MDNRLLVVAILISAVIVISVFVYRHRKKRDKLFRLGGSGGMKRGGSGAESELTIWLKEISQQIAGLSIQLGQMNIRLKQIDSYLSTLVAETSTIRNESGHQAWPADKPSIERPQDQHTYAPPSNARQDGSRPPAPALVKIDTIETARKAYQRLVDGQIDDLAIKMFYASLDSAFEGQVLGEINHQFKQSGDRHSQFVIIAKNDNEGWLFPNPGILFTESMKMVFPDLSREEFDSDKQRIQPLPVRSISQGAWERAR